MKAVPQVLVVGGDGLAICVCQELLALHGQRATVVWMHDDALAPKFRAKVTAVDPRCHYVQGPPNEGQTLLDAGVVQAESIMVLSDDDQLNLQVALKARDLNAKIRIV